MYIKQIILEGFRSYGEHNALSSLSPNTNVIIGSNGSGKSNIFSAIQFVLSDEFSHLSGQQRQQLIHDTASDKRLMTASVTVVMDNTDRRIPVANDEVKIRRQIGAQKDQFFVDGKLILSSQITSMLETAGFSKSNPYYIVKQGKINELATSTDEYRLNVMREVAGTRIYDERKKQAIAMLTESRHKLTTITECIAYIDDKLAKLEEEKEDLAAFLVWDKRRRNLEFTIYNSECEIAKQRIMANDHKHSQFNEVLNEKREKLHDIQARIKAEESRLKKVRNDIVSYRNDLAEVESAVDDYAREKAAVESRIKDLQEKLGDDDHTQIKVTKQIDALKAEIKKKKSDLVSINGRYGDIKKEEKEIVMKLREKSRRRVELYQKTERKKQFKTVEERNRWIMEELPKIEASIESSAKRIAELKTELSVIETEKSKLEDEQQGLSEENDKLKADLNRFNKQKLELNHERKNIEFKRSQLWESENTMKLNLTKLDESKLKVERNLMKITGTSSTVGRESVNKVMDMFRDKTLNSSSDELEYRPIIEGYYGQVIDCFGYDPNLSKAIEVTAKNKLFHHIVADDKIGTRILREVNQNKLRGDITFIAINKLIVKPIDIPPLNNQAAVMKDLLKYESKYDRVMSYLFGRTLVCRNMEVAATFVRSSKLNCVTLDGDYYSSKGAMTGGYMSRVSTMELFLSWKDLVSEHKEINQRLRANVIEKERVVNLVEQCLNRVVSVENDLSKNRRKFENVLANKERIHNKLQELEKKQSSLEKSISALEETMPSMRTSRDSFSAELKLALSSQLNEREQTEMEQLISDIEQLQQKSAQIFKRKTEIEREKSKLESLLYENLQPRQNELECTILEITVANRLNDLEKEKSCNEVYSAKIDDIRKQLEEKNAIMDKLIAKESEIKTQLENMKALEEKQMEIVNNEAKKLRKLANSNMNYEKKLEELNRKLRYLGTVPVDSKMNYSKLSSKEQYNKLREINEILAQYENINQRALDQYNQSKEKVEILRKEKEEIDRSYAAIQQLIETLEHEKLQSIHLTFKQVSAFFRETFAHLVPEGNAYIDMVYSDGTQSGTSSVDSSQTSLSSGGISTGVNISALPQIDNFVGVRVRVAFNGSSTVKELSQLSGGQKSLVALAFIFAIQKCDPAPFYLFDEVDSALDPLYRARLNKLIRRMSAKSQFIMTTFRRELLDCADKFYGVILRIRISHVEEIDKQTAVEFVTNVESRRESGGTKRATRKSKTSSAAGDNDGDGDGRTEI